MSAVNVALPAFAAAAAAAPAAQQSIDISLPAGPTAANPPHAAAAGEWDRQTDGRTPCGYTDSLPLTMRATPIMTVMTTMIMMMIVVAYDAARTAR